MKIKDIIVCMLATFSVGCLIGSAEIIPNIIPFSIIIGCFGIFIYLCFRS